MKIRQNCFLGLAAGIEHPWKYLFTRGTKEDAAALKKYLGKRYSGEAMLCKNGRSALTLALKAYFSPGDAIIINGFTCYAVYEAVKTAGLTPIFADITRENLNFDVKTLENLYKKDADESNIKEACGIIVQNSLGNPVDMKEIEKFAGKHGLIIIEDLAHSAGIKYPDDREAGTIGAATVLSFGKEKSIDAISGGAVIFRHPRWHEVTPPKKMPRLSDYLRERWYPVLGLWCRQLTKARLGGTLMRILIKIHFVERSADNRLDINRRPANFESKLALEQFKNMKRSSNWRLREFYLVEDRKAVLEELKEAGYYFDGLWYEKPVSPKRYYKKVHFDEEACPIATEVSKQIVNLPNYYNKIELTLAREIIEKYLVEEKDGKK